MYSLGYIKDTLAFISFIVLAYLIKSRLLSFNVLFIMCIFAAIVDGIFTFYPSLHNQPFPVASI